MKSAYQIIRRPVITEKGLGVKETEQTLVFEVAARATKTEIKEAVQSIFKVKVDHVRTANFLGKERRRGKFTGFRGAQQERLIGARPVGACMLLRVPHARVVLLGPLDRVAPVVECTGSEAPPWLRSSRPRSCLVVPS